MCEATDVLIDNLTKHGNRLSNNEGLDCTVPIKVLGNLCQKHIFTDLNDHMIDCSPEDNHVFILVKLVSAAYTKIKLHHLAKRATERSNTGNVRRRLTKLILFKNQ